MEKIKSISSRKNKVKHVVSVIKNIAIKKEPGERLNTVREFASQLNISTSTLYNALRKLEELEIIDCKNGSGIYVSPEINKKNIGIVFGGNVFSSSMSPVYSIFLEQFKKRISSNLHNEKYCVYFDISEIQDNSGISTHYHLKKDLEYGKLDGILLIAGTKQKFELFQKMVPTVAFGFNGIKKGTVNVDYKSIVETGVNVLFQKGCKKIGLITLLKALRKEGYFEDIQGYKNKLQQIQLKYSNRFVYDANSDISGETYEEAGYRLMTELYNKNKDIEGIVITDDIATKGVLVAAKEYGLEIGKNIKIATHANKGSPALKLYEKDLILLEIDPVEIVDNMLYLLEECIKNNIQCDESVLIKPKIKMI